MGKDIQYRPTVSTSQIRVDDILLNVSFCLIPTAIVYDAFQMVATESFKHETKSTSLNSRMWSSINAIIQLKHVITTSYSGSKCLQMQCISITQCELILWRSNRKTISETIITGDYPTEIPSSTHLNCDQNLHGNAMCISLHF